MHAIEISKWRLDVALLESEFSVNINKSRIQQSSYTVLIWVYKLLCNTFTLWYLNSVWGIAYHIDL